MGLNREGWDGKGWHVVGKDGKGWNGKARGRMRRDGMEME